MDKIYEYANQLIILAKENSNKNYLEEMLWDEFSKMGIELKETIQKIKFIKAKNQADESTVEACMAVINAFNHWRNFNSYSTESTEK